MNFGKHDNQRRHREREKARKRDREGEREKGCHAIPRESSHQLITGRGRALRATSRWDGCKVTAPSTIGSLLNRHDPTVVKLSDTAKSFELLRWRGALASNWFELKHHHNSLCKVNPCLSALSLKAAHPGSGRQLTVDQRHRSARRIRKEIYKHLEVNFDEPAFNLRTIPQFYPILCHSPVNDDPWQTRRTVSWPRHPILMRVIHSDATPSFLRIHQSSKHASTRMNTHYRRSVGRHVPPPLSARFHKLPFMG